MEAIIITVTEQEFAAFVKRNNYVKIDETTYYGDLDYIKFKIVADKVESYHDKTHRKAILKERNRIHYED